MALFQSATDFLMKCNPFDSVEEDITQVEDSSLRVGSLQILREVVLGNLVRAVLLFFIVVYQEILR